MNRVSKTTLLLVTCLFLSVALLAYSGRIIGIDSQATFATSAVAAEHGRWDMNIIAWVMWTQQGRGAQGIVSPDGDIYSKKSPLVAIALVPATWLGGRLPLIQPMQAALLTIPIIFALTGALFILTAVRFGFSSQLGLIGALWWAFGTYALANTSEIFAEPIIALALLLAVYGMLGETRRDVLLTGIGCGLIVLGNLASAMLLPVIAIGLFRKKLAIRQFIERAVLFAIPIVAAFVVTGLFNWMRSGNVLTSGYQLANNEGFSTPLWVGLSGMLITPYRGILWYAPLTWLTLPGWWLMRKKYSANILLLLIVVQLVTYSLWWDWAGGLVWGPRFLLPVLPLMILLALPALQKLWSHQWGKLCVGVLLAFSLFIQIPGVLMHYSVHEIALRQMYPATTSHYIIAMQDRAALLPQYSPIIGNLRNLITEDWWPVWFKAEVRGVGLLIGLGVLIQITTLWPALRGRVPDKRLTIAAVLIACASLIATPIVVTQLRRSPNLQLLDDYFSEQVQRGDVALVNSRDSDSLLNAPHRPYTYGIIDDALPDDELAQTIIANVRQYPRIWFMTRDPVANWIEAALWADYFAGATRISNGFRMVLFDTHTMQVQPQSLAVHFDSIVLEAVALERTTDALYLALDWSGTIPQNANLFIHVLDAQGHIIEQHDRLPLNGIVVPGNATITDRHVFAQSPGQLAEKIRVGWVDADGVFIHPTATNDFLLLDVP